MKLKKLNNTIQTINTKNYGSDYWEFTKKKIIWARKDDKITNERRKTEFDRRNYPYIGSGIDNLDDKLSQMDYCREYEIVPY